MKQKVLNPIEPSPASDNGHLALVNNLADATISTMSLFSYFRKNMVGRDSIGYTELLPWKMRKMCEFATLQYER